MQAAAKLLRAGKHVLWTRILLILRRIAGNYEGVSGSAAGAEERLENALQDLVDFALEEAAAVARAGEAAVFPAAVTFLRIMLEVEYSHADPGICSERAVSSVARSSIMVLSRRLEAARTILDAELLLAGAAIGLPARASRVECAAA